MVARVIAPAALLISLLSGWAQGQFLNLPQYGSGLNLGQIVKAEVNNDGVPDLVSAEFKNNNGYIVVLLGNGAGQFGSPKTTQVTSVASPNLSTLAVADFNGDGRADVALLATNAITGAGVIAVMLGNGDGTFQTPKTSPS